MDNSFYILFFRAPDVPGVKFLEPERVQTWFDEFGEDNFIGGVCCKKLDMCYDVVEIILKFLGPYVVTTTKCRAIKGPPDKLEAFLNERLGQVMTPYEGEGADEWEKNARQNMVRTGIST